MIRIDKQSQIPIYEQFIEQVERLVLSGFFSEDEPLPSVRALSQTLSVNPNTLQKAYAELERKGLCYTVPGTGRMLSADARRIALSEQRKELEQIERLSKQMAQAGIPIGDVLAAVEKAYEGGANK